MPDYDERRNFLKLLLASVAAEAVDFEQLLWVPKPIVTVPSSFKSIYFKGLPIVFNQFGSWDNIVYFSEKQRQFYEGELCSQ